MGQRDEAALRGLVGAGPSRVGVGGAMRARDVSRPTEADLEAAVESLVIRRAWRTREPTEQPKQATQRPAHQTPPRYVPEPLPLDVTDQPELTQPIEPTEPAEPLEPAEPAAPLKPADAATPPSAPVLHHSRKSKHRKRR